MKKHRSRVRKPGNFEDDGHLRETCFHACIQGDRLRFQVNSGDVLRISRWQDIKKLSKWFALASEFLKAGSKAKVKAKRGKR